MNSIYTWMQNNIDFVFFVYGLAFIVMGVAILTQPKKRSRFKLANILWFLALFGLTHGTNEFLDMWAIIKGRTLVLDIVRWFMLVISYIFLFEFGRRIFCLNRPKCSYRWLSSLVVLLILIFGFISSDFWKMGSIWARYLLGLPGGVLTAFGFYLHYKYQKKELKPLKVKKYFLLASASFLFYGILGGLIVPKANFFPASWLNTDSFLSVVHIPVQLFRTICAIAAVIGIVPILRIFHWETTTSIRDALEMREKITEGLDEGILLIDRNFKILWANRKQKEQFGQITGEYCYRATRGTDIPCRPPHNICPIVEVLRTGKPATVTHTHFDKQGNEVFVEVAAYPVKNETGEITQFIYVTRDITERKRAEKTLRESEERYKSLFKANIDGIIIADPTTKKFRYANPAMCRMLGYSEEELTQMGVADIHPKESLEQVFAEFEALASGAKITAKDLLCVRKDGQVISVSINAGKVMIDQTKYLLAIFRDITERKKAEDALKESEQRLNIILNSILVGVVIIDAETHQIVDVNPLAIELIGLPKEKIVSKKCHKFICPAEEGKCPISDLGQTVDLSERVLIRGNGKEIPILKTVTPVSWQGHSYLVESFIDITERKQAEQGLSTKMKEIEEFNCLAVGRELKMIELKREINRLLAERGMEQIYEIVE